VLYLDNDTLITLAELNILKFFCAAMAEEHEDYNLFCLRRCPAFVSDQVNEPVRTEVLTFLKKVGPVSEHLRGREFAELSPIHQVDVEAELFACCANDEGTLVVTGDLKAVRAVSKHASSTTKGKLKGKMRCTEQCVLAIIDHEGFQKVAQCWSTSTIDHAFFETLIGESEASVRSKLDGRLKDLTHHMKQLLGIVP